MNAARTVPTWHVAAAFLAGFVACLLLIIGATLWTLRGEEDDD